MESNTNVRIFGCLYLPTISTKNIVKLAQQLRDVHHTYEVVKSSPTNHSYLSIATHKVFYYSHVSPRLLIVIDWLPLANPTYTS